MCLDTSDSLFKALHIQTGFSDFNQFWRSQEFEKIIDSKISQLWMLVDWALFLYCYYQQGCLHPVKKKISAFLLIVADTNEHFILRNENRLMHHFVSVCIYACVCVWCFTQYFLVAFHLQHYVINSHTRCKGNACSSRKNVSLSRIDSLLKFLQHVLKGILGIHYQKI